jgi:hypothetical protein
VDVDVAVVNVVIVVVVVVVVVVVGGGGGGGGGEEEENYVRIRYDQTILLVNEYWMLQPCVC